MQKVIVDANGLMTPFQFGLNLDIELQGLLGECEILVPESVMGELVNLSKRLPEAKAAVELAKGCRVVKVEARSPDEAIVKLAKAEGACVLTNDRALIQMLKRERIPVVRLRSRSHLVLEGGFV
jgi:rRNA-processing protein FCF1